MKNNVNESMESNEETFKSHCTISFTWYDGRVLNFG
jgi:hypothetical protein